MLQTIIFFFALVSTVIFAVSGICTIMFMNAEAEDNLDLEYLTKLTNISLVIFFITFFTSTTLWSVLYHFNK